MSDLIDRQDAIEALGEEPPVWYDGDDEIAERNQWRRDKAAIEAIPPACNESKQQEIIRCKDCKHYRSYAGVIDGYCGMAEWYGRYQYPNDFCSRAKRRTDE